MTLRKPTEERRRELVGAAIKIIGELGLREFTMARLSQEVGIKDGTIFRHFEDKREILHAVVDQIEELLQASTPNDPPDPINRLEEFLTTRMQAVVAHPGLLSIVFSDQLAHAMGGEGRLRVARMRNRGRDFVRACLAEAVEKKLINPETDIESATLLVNGMVMSLLFAAKDGAIEGSIERAGRRAWRNLLTLLRR